MQFFRFSMEMQNSSCTPHSKLRADTTIIFHLIYHLTGCTISGSSYLQKSSSLEELQGLLYGVVQAVVASPGQVGSDQTHSDHQPPAHSRGDI